MSKTKKVIDQMNENKNQSVNPRQLDINRMRIETISSLFDAAYHAMKEVQGDRTLGDVVLQSEVYGDLWKVSSIGYNRFIGMTRNKQQYRKMELPDLLKQLYHRMQMFYHYAECKGVELPGIAHHMEPNGWFTVNLKDCAMNMEHSFIDPHADRYEHQREGILFSIGLNLPLLESEDPESPDSHLSGEYDEFLNFLCDFGEECRDVYPCEYSHAEAICDILAQMDMISDMNNNDKQ